MSSTRITNDSNGMSQCKVSLNGVENISSTHQTLLIWASIQLGISESTENQTLADFYFSTLALFALTANIYILALFALTTNISKTKEIPNKSCFLQYWSSHYLHMFSWGQ